MAHYKGAGQRKQFQLLLELESEMKALALILFSTLLSFCYSQNSVFSPPEGGDHYPNVPSRYNSYLCQGRDAGAGISAARGAVHPRIPAVLERVTVTDLLTAESMMDTEDARYQ